MPSIDVAMARSLRGGVWQIISDSINNELVRRNIVDDTRTKVDDFKTAISSWDNCMAANFCKWPVIAIIIVGGLIILSIVTCIVRCCCCGVSCCCSCFQCLKCCGNCCGCCDPPGGPKQKYLDAPYNPEQGYKTQAPMHYSTPASVHPPVAAPPQYAEFDMPRKGGEDALPAMPSWDDSANKKVLVNEEEVEMDNLKKPTSDTAPLIGGASPLPTSHMPMEHPSAAYGQPNGPRSFTPQTEPTIPFTQVPGSVYSSAPSGRNYPQDQPYDSMPPPVGGPGSMRSQSPAQGYRGYGQDPMNQSYGQLPPPGNGYANQGMYGSGSQAAPEPYGLQRRGTGGTAPPDPYGMQRQDTGGAASPGPYGMQRRDTGGTASPGPYGMQRRGTGGPAPPGPYGMQRQDTGGRQSPAMNRGPGPYGAQPRQSPAPRNGQGYGAPGYNAPRTYSPAPERQYGNASPRPMPNNRPPPERQFGQSPPQSPITNNSGFDFTSGFSRPQEYDRRPSESHEPAGQEGYPGYKPYSRPQEGWSGV
jgi:hypothetical protein